MQTLMIDTGQTRPITDLRLDGGTQMRAGGTEKQRVEEYAELYRSGHVLPPVVVFDDGRELWLADGFHRVEARQAAGLEDVSCDIRPGTHHDAFLFALSANAAHGLRRTRKDLQHSIRQALQHDGLAERTDKALAALIVCSPTAIARIRKEMVEAGQIPDHRVRKDEAGHEVAVRGEEKPDETVPGQAVLDTKPLPFDEVWQPEGTLSATNKYHGETVTVDLSIGTVQWRGQPIELGLSGPIPLDPDDQGAKGLRSSIAKEIDAVIRHRLLVWAPGLPDADREAVAEWISASTGPAHLVELFTGKMGKLKQYDYGLTVAHPSLGASARAAIAQIIIPDQPLVTYLQRLLVVDECNAALHGCDHISLDGFEPQTLEREHDGETMKIRVGAGYGNSIEIQVQGVKGLPQHDRIIRFDESEAELFATDEALLTEACTRLAEKVRNYRKQQERQTKQQERKEKGPTLRERRALLKRQRECELAARLGKEIADWEVTPVAEDLLRLDSIDHHYGNNWDDLSTGLDQDLDQILDETWKHLRRRLAGMLKIDPDYRWTAPPSPGQLTTLAAMFSVDIEQLWQQVQADLPEPEEWTKKPKPAKPAAGKPEADAKPAPKKRAAKKKPAAKKKSAAKQKSGAS